MSRTKKKRIKYAADWKNINAKKMKPYLADKDTGEMKFHPERMEYVDGYTKGVTATEKLITRNANRSKKKAMRQQSKKMIKDLLSND